MQTAITEYQRLEGLNKKFIFSKFWRLEVEGEGASRLVTDEATSLVVDDCFLSVSSHSLSSMHAWRERKLWGSFFSF